MVLQHVFVTTQRAHTIKWQFHLMILISLAVTVFTTRNVVTIKWNRFEDIQDIDNSCFFTEQCHLMAYTFLVVKTVTAR